MVSTPEQNWSHDPVEIISMEPSGKDVAAATTNEFPGVTFSPPVQATLEEKPFEQTADIQREPVE